MVRVTSVAEARLSAMALFIDVARGSPQVAERRAWLRPFWPADGFGAYIARGLLAEYALWQGNAETAASEAAEIVDSEVKYMGGYSPPVIRVAAVGLSAQADLAARARAAGDAAAAAAAVEAARALIEAAREGAAYRRRPKYVLGVEGRSWLARAEAEWRRAQRRQRSGRLAGGAGRVRPRVRVRDRQVPVAAGRGARRGRPPRRGAAGMAAGVRAADRLGALPLRAALADLARRARLRTAGPAGPAVPAGPA